MHLKPEAQQARRSATFLFWGVLTTGLVMALGAPPIAAEEHREVPTASVEFEDQESDGDAVLVAAASLPDGGFIVMHDEKIAEGLVEESIVGVSDYLEAGSHTDILVSLDPPLSGTQVLLAMAHQDTNENGTFDFADSDGAEDGAYPDGQGGAVLDDGQVEISEGIPAPGFLFGIVAIGAALAVTRYRLR